MQKNPNEVFGQLNILKMLTAHPISGGTWQQIRQGSCSRETYILLGVEIQAINK